jgi:phosphatidate phosphatase APP1
LYEYILEFTAVNHIPRGIFLLSQLKGFSQLLKTGQNNHGTKFTRIVRIMEAFPKHRVILLGDSSQQDPYIYEAIVKHFPKQVHAVYIRDVFERSFQKVQEVLHNIEAAGVPCLFFKQSKDAILHSVKIGLVAANEAEEKLQEAEQEKAQMA